jgi:hypothetical protein
LTETSKWIGQEFGFRNAASGRLALGAIEKNTALQIRLRVPKDLWNPTEADCSRLKLKS